MDSFRKSLLEKDHPSLCASWHLLSDERSRELAGRLLRSASPSFALQAEWDTGLWLLFDAIRRPAQRNNGREEVTLGQVLERFPARDPLYVYGLNDSARIDCSTHASVTATIDVLQLHDDVLLFDEGCSWIVERTHHGSIWYWAEGEAFHPCLIGLISDTRIGLLALHRHGRKIELRIIWSQGLPEREVWDAKNASILHLKLSELLRSSYPLRDAAFNPKRHKCGPGDTVLFEIDRLLSYQGTPLLPYLKLEGAKRLADELGDYLAADQ